MGNSTQEQKDKIAKLSPEKKQEIKDSIARTIERHKGLKVNDKENFKLTMNKVENLISLQKYKTSIQFKIAGPVTVCYIKLKTGTIAVGLTVKSPSENKSVWRGKTIALERAMNAFRVNLIMIEFGETTVYNKVPTIRASNALKYFAFNSKESNIPHAYLVISLTSDASFEDATYTRVKSFIDTFKRLQKDIESCHDTTDMIVHDDNELKYYVEKGDIVKVHKIIQDEIYGGSNVR